MILKFFLLLALSMLAACIIPLVKPKIDDHFAPQMNLNSSGATSPSLSLGNNRVYPLDGSSEPIIQGQTFISDTPSFAGGLVAGTFTCSYRTLGLNTNDPNYAASGTNCNDLQSISINNGVTITGSLTDNNVLAGFNTTTGILTWTPTKQQWGSYVFSIGATAVAGGVVSGDLVLSVRSDFTYPDFSSTTMLAYYDAIYSTQDSSLPGILSIPRADGLTTDDTSSWSSLIGSGSGSFTFTTVSPWLGTGQTQAAALNPYQLSFDGANDRLSLGQPLSGMTEIYASTWFRSNDTTKASAIIFGNGGGAGNGFTVRQSSSNGNYVDLIFNTVTENSYAAAIAALDPIVYFRLDEAQGAANAINAAAGASSCGAGCNLTYQNSPTMQVAGGIPTETNTSMITNGSNQYADVADNNALDPGAGSSWTITAWARPENYSQQAYITGKMIGAGWYLAIAGSIFANTSGKKLAVGYRTGAATKRHSLTDNDVVDGNWHFYVAVFDQAANDVFVYVDGVLLAVTDNNAGGWPTPDNAVSFEIGRGNGGGNYFAGGIDEVAVFGTALTGPQVLSLYNTGVSSMCRSQSTIISNGWYQAGVLYDGGGSAHLFLNGKHECMINGELLNDGATNFTIGAHNAGSNFFDGSIGKIKLFGTNSGVDVVSWPAIENDVDVTANRFREVPIENIYTSSLALHLDAANANLGTVSYPSGCAAENNRWYDLKRKSYPVTLGSFDPTDCLGVTADGWHGIGTAADPYRLHFDAVDDFAITPSGSEFRPNKDFTIEAWVRPEVLAGQTAIFSHDDDGAGDDSYGLWLNGANPEFYAHSGVGQTITGATVLVAGNWYHLVGIYDNSNNLRIYINGTEDANSPQAGAGNVAYPLTEHLNIGRRGGTGAPLTAYFNGDIAVIRFYQTTLSLAQIKRNCLAQQDRYGVTCAAP